MKLKAFKQPILIDLTEEVPESNFLRTAIGGLLCVCFLAELAIIGQCILAVWGY